MGVSVTSASEDEMRSLGMQYAGIHIISEEGKSTSLYLSFPHPHMEERERGEQVQLFILYFYVHDFYIEELVQRDQQLART